MAATYDPKIDYAAEIKKAQAAGAGTSVISHLEAQRAAKIAASTPQQLQSWGVSSPTTQGYNSTPASVQDIEGNSIMEKMANKAKAEGNTVLYNRLSGNVGANKSTNTGTSTGNDTGANTLNQNNTDTRGAGYTGYSADQVADAWKKKAQSGVDTSASSQIETINNNLAATLAEIDTYKAGLQKQHQSNLETIHNNEFATSANQRELMNQAGWNPDNSGLAIGEMTRIKMGADKQRSDAANNLASAINEANMKAAMAKTQAGNSTSAVDRWKSAQMAGVDADALLNAETLKRQYYTEDRNYGLQERQVGAGITGFDPETGKRTLEGQQVDMTLAQQEWERSWQNKMFDYTKLRDSVADGQADRAFKLQLDMFAWDKSEDNPVNRAAIIQNQIEEIRLGWFRDPNSPENRSRYIQAATAQKQLDDLMAVPSAFYGKEAQAKLDQIFAQTKGIYADIAQTNAQTANIKKSTSLMGIKSGGSGIKSGGSGIKSGGSGSGSGGKLTQDEIIGQWYNDLKPNSVKDATAKMKAKRGDIEKVVGAAGYDRLWNMVLEDGIAMGQAKPRGTEWLDTEIKKETLKEKQFFN